MGVTPNVPAKQTVAQAEMTTIRDLFVKNMSSIEQVLPKHLTADRLMKVAMVAISRNQKLLNCTPMSLLQSVMASAELGLDFTPGLGYAYLVPYGNQCTFITGYRGMIDLVRRSGQITSIEARLVYDGDEFNYEYGTDPKITHRPKSGINPKNDNVIFAYTVCRFKDGGTQFEVMSRPEINAIRERSKASSNGPWVTDFGEMAKKTVVRRMVKYLPATIEISKALAYEDRAEQGIDIGDLVGSGDLSAPTEEADPKTGEIKEG
jgi:recombination protein RecT